MLLAGVLFNTLVVSVHSMSVLLYLSYARHWCSCAPLHGNDQSALVNPSTLSDLCHDEADCERHQGIEVLCGG
jgi:hypothetical protein